MTELHPQIIGDPPYEVGREVTFRVQVEGYEGDGINYQWIFRGPDRTVVGNKAGDEAPYTFDQTGDHQIKVAVWTDSGLTGSSTVTVTVTKPSNEKPKGKPPRVRIEIDPRTPTVGQPVSFDGGASADPDAGQIDEYKWSFYRPNPSGFGRGELEETRRGVETERRFDVPGDWTVGLTVYTDNDDMNYREAELIVRE